MRMRHLILFNAKEDELLKTFIELEVQQIFIEVFTFCDFILVFLFIFLEISYKKEKAELLPLYTVFMLRLPQNPL